MHEPVPLDIADEIRELAGEGFGANQISSITGIYASTVRRVISGDHKSYSDKLSTRQIQGVLNHCFKPLT